MTYNSDPAELTIQDIEVFESATNVNYDVVKYGTEPITSDYELVLPFMYPHSAPYYDFSDNKHSVTLYDATVGDNFAFVVSSNLTNHFSATESALLPGSLNQAGAYFVRVLMGGNTFSSALDWCVEYWLKTPLPDVAFAPFYIRDNTNITSLDFQHGCYHSPGNGQSYLGFKDAEANTYVFSIPESNSWRHYAWQMNAGAMKLYLDGTLCPVSAEPFTFPVIIESSNPPFPSTEELYFGQFYQSAYCLSEFRIYNGVKYTTNFTPQHMEVFNIIAWT